MLKQLGIMIAVAVTYLFYHVQFFSFVEQVLDWKEKRRFAVFVTFGLNYAWFVAASILTLHLIVNWTIFFFFFFAEICMIYRVGADKSVMLASFGIIMGMAWNICFRCIFALMLNRPLTAFDNQTDLPGNLKKYPISLGFAVTGLLFYYLKRKHFFERLRMVMKDRSSLRFNIGVQFVLYVYLALNLLGYYVPENSFFLKFWGIKSAIFVFIGLNISNVYTVRMSKLNLYRKKMREDRRSMLAENKNDYVFRYGGDEFLLLFLKKSSGQVTALLQSIEEQLRQHSAEEGLPFVMSISFGVVQSSQSGSADQLLKLADYKMYEQKRGKAGK